ncbi:hypothetical protein CPS_3349 [Colwellia psychrerythraea 34H]|uniref:Uncharacterized protein n=1 Tax=Colwellia psychrerythraea (strain 34H / ATCC BAA-681) TaxID=167879 RepID=Q47YU5_COLP3|nr:hypothetical protein CPS_3349 [Colwellia psychrerythraea 34H]
MAVMPVLIIELKKLVMPQFCFMPFTLRLQVIFGKSVFYFALLHR